MPANPQRARELFLHAVGKLPPEQWDGFVAEACQGDGELERQVRHLLQVHREAGSFLESPAVPGVIEALARQAGTEPTEAEPAGGNGEGVSLAFRTPCADDQDLREEVEALLRAHEAAGSFLESTAPSSVVSVDEKTAGEGPDAVIGPYRLLQRIGEGGMGTVWMAEQTEPIKRVVALKLIKAGLDSKQFIARFEAERQALALMDHTNIARVLDAGTTAAGRPYLVMDLVKGVPITTYCDEHHLTPRQRLELFVPVCQAVQHAHQKGVIHRDLKPSNVLVALYDGRPVPKVIDFGIAKAAGQSLTEKTLVTGFGTIVGTLEYMSPEQAENDQLDVDTRSDIYSLGVLLYELLTGSPPLDRESVRTAAYAEILRQIREVEPPRPSARLSDSGDRLVSLAALRRTEPARLAKQVRGELDWVVMKALDKDRTRRYETADAFARDVERHLADEPVEAGPPSAAYRLRKFVRRNKRSLTMAAVVAGALLVLVGTVGWMVRERAAREQEIAHDRATRRAVIKERVTVALEEAIKRRREGRWKEALDAAKRAEALTATGDSDDGETRGRAREVLGDMQMLADLEDVRVRATRNAAGFDLKDEDSGNARAFREYGIDIDALDRDEAAMRIRARPIRYELAVLLDSWAHVRRRLAKQATNRVGKDWRELLEIARAVDPDPWRDQFRKAVLGGDSRALIELATSAPISSMPAETVDRLGDALMYMGATVEAADFLKKGQALHPQDYWINANLALCLERLGRHDEAIPYYTAALALRPEAGWARRNLGGPAGQDDEAGATSSLLRARSYIGLSQWDKAAAEYAKAGLSAQPLNDDTFAYACLFLIRGDGEGYDRLCQGMIRRAAQAQDPFEAYILARTCAMADKSPIDPARAVEWANRAVAGAQHPWYYHALGLAQYRAGQFEPALQSLADDEWEYRPLNWLGLALVRHRLGHADQAREYLAKAVRWMEREGPSGPGRPTKLRHQDWLEAQVLRREIEEMLK